MTMPESGRQAAHILLDAVSAFDDNLGDDATNASAMNLAYSRLQEVNAVTATMDDDDILDIDLSDLLGGAVVTMKRLAHMAADARGESVEDVIIAAREFLDRND